MQQKKHFHDPVVVRVGDQTRELVLTPGAWRKAQKALGGRDPREALVGGGLDPVVIVGACALLHAGKCSDSVVEAWLTHRPGDIPAFIDAVSECAFRFLVATGIVDPLPAAPPNEGGSTSPATPTEP